MKQITSNRLGRRGEQILAVLRDTTTPLPRRELLRERTRDDQIAYTEVSATVSRLVETDLLGVHEAICPGSLRYLYEFQPKILRRELVDAVVDNVLTLLGRNRLHLLRQREKEQPLDVLSEKQSNHDTHEN